MTKLSFLIDCNFFDLFLKNRDVLEISIDLVEKGIISFSTIYLVLREINQIPDFDKKRKILEIVNHLKVKILPG